MAKRKSESDALLPSDHDIHAGIIHGVLMVFLSFDVTFTTIVRPHPLCTPLTCSMQETLMRVRSVPKLVFLSVTDIHTYIPAQNEMRSRIS